MNKLHDIKGRFTSRKAKIRLWIIMILVIAGILSCAVVGAGYIYNSGKEKIVNFFTPKVKVVVAETPEPTDMKEWVLWRVKKEGIDPYEAYAIINCESRWNPESINGSHNNGGNGTDLGLWQINTKYQSQVKPSCSLDYHCATDEAIKIYKKRGNWSAWACSEIIGLK